MTTETSRQIDLTAVSRLVLRHGRSIPRLGLGTWPTLGEECENAVRYALLAGYRLFDTAFAYRNEEAIGRALKDAGVPRGELFISSKFNKEFHSVDGVQRAYDDSLRRLGLDYLDMFVCHGPVPAQGEYAEACKGLVRLLQQGRVKAIGVPNFKPLTSPKSSMPPASFPASTKSSSAPASPAYSHAPCTKNSES